jgi:cyclophilin family peptidyl-prolyl cis-trans isomerase
MTNKTIIVGTLAAIVAAGSVGGLFYYRTQKIETCETALKRFKDDHLCISTNKGNMVFELYKDAAPIAVEKIKKLSNTDKFFDNLGFYRVVNDYVVQGGIQDIKVDKQGIANLGSELDTKFKLSEEQFATESNFDKLGLNTEDLANLKQEKMVSTPDLNTRKFEFGSIAFANAGPGTNSTEIFIVTSKDKESTNTKYLNGRFSNFGKIVEGDSVLATLNSLGPKGADGKPTSPITIFEARAK